jgi:hypothetical protein
MPEEKSARRDYIIDYRITTLKRKEHRFRWWSAQALLGILNQTIVAPPV